jgi:uncharacterized repeat protein (TIGR02543 family)
LTTPGTTKPGSAVVKKSLLITFNASRGKALSFKSKSVVDGNKYGSMPFTKRAGYSFAGWYTRAKGGLKVTPNSNVSLTKNSMLYAHWKAKKYTVTFYHKNPSKALKKKVTFGKKFGKVAKYKWSGYKFMGWYTKKSGGKKITSKSIVKITRNITLYPHWKKL